MSKKKENRINMSEANLSSCYNLSILVIQYKKLQHILLYNFLFFPFISSSSLFNSTFLFTPNSTFSCPSWKMHGTIFFTHCFNLVPLFDHCISHFELRLRKMNEKQDFFRKMPEYRAKNRKTGQGVKKKQEKQEKQGWSGPCYRHPPSHIVI